LGDRLTDFGKGHLLLIVRGGIQKAAFSSGSEAPNKGPEEKGNRWKASI
jgi:hypothetical protein